MLMLYKDKYGLAFGWSVSLLISAHGSLRMIPKNLREYNVSFVQRLHQVKISTWHIYSILSRHLVEDVASHESYTVHTSGYRWVRPPPLGPEGTHKLKNKETKPLK